MTIANSSVLALDVGEKRVGVAVASMIARLPRALATLERGDDFLPKLEQLIESERPAALVLGLPRGLEGQHTDQTRSVESFADQLAKELKLPIFFQDEALTSVQAEEELDKSGKPYQKGDVDALAATYILNDFLNDKANLAKIEAGDI